MKIGNIIKMEVGDIVEFRCPQIFMEKRFESRGVGIIIGERIENPGGRNIAFKIQWGNSEVSWEHDTYLGKL